MIYSARTCIHSVLLLFLYLSHSVLLRNLFLLCKKKTVTLPPLAVGNRKLHKYHSSHWITVCIASCASCCNNQLPVFFDYYLSSLVCFVSCEILSGHQSVLFDRFITCDFALFTQLTKFQNGPRTTSTVYRGTDARERGQKFVC